MGLSQGGRQVNNENDNITNDPFLDEYYKIKAGIGQPEIIDKMIYERHDQRNCSPRVSDEILYAADRIRNKWTEEAVREFVLRMSWYILHLEETLKRHSIEHEPYRSYYKDYK
jgi:hypothetical protein